MPNRKPLNVVDLPDPRVTPEGYDLRHLENIVRALDYLRADALNTGVNEVVTVVESTFNIVYSAYYSILHNNMLDLPPADQG